MARKFAIILRLCLGVVCAFIHRFGTSSLEELTGETDQKIVVSCDQLLNKWPRDNFHLLLTDFQRGKHFVSYDHDQDENWELVYVPLFPSHLKSLGNNFNSVIVYFDDVKNEDELNERLASGELDTQLWYTQQKLPDDIHSDLAQSYRLMDFSKCVVLQGGFRPPSKDIATYAVLGSYLGLLSCGVIVAWNLVAMFLPKRGPRDFFNDEEDQPATNRAGLPDF
jgi:hypothetical protein